MGKYTSPKKPAPKTGNIKRPEKLSSDIKALTGKTVKNKPPTSR